MVNEKSCLECIGNMTDIMLDLLAKLDLWVQDDNNLCKISRGIVNNKWYFPSQGKKKIKNRRGTLCFLEISLLFYKGPIFKRAEPHCFSPQAFSQVPIPQLGQLREVCYVTWVSNCLMCTPSVLDAAALVTRLSQNLLSPNLTYFQ